MKISRARALLVASMGSVFSALVACGDGAATGVADAGTSDGAHGDHDGAASADGSTDASLPSMDASCTILCAKKAAAACPKDDPSAPDCQQRCVTANTHPGCGLESRALIACSAAGNVVCSVDGESTPVAICGPETRALAACLASHPPVDAGPEASDAHDD